jgi:hypothetical protein
MSWKHSASHAQYAARNGRINVELGAPLRIQLESDGRKLGHSVADLTLFPCEPGARDASPVSVHDAFVRQEDLIASYAQEYPWPFGWQVDFRFHASPFSDLHLMELWLSVQTSQWECNPQLWWKPGQSSAAWQDTAPSIVSPEGQAALLIHPLDRVDCKVVCSEDRAVEHIEVFGRQMEKGVIRRARFLLAWGSSRISAEHLGRVYDLFADSPLPLTA